MDIASRSDHIIGIATHSLTYKCLEMKYEIKHSTKIQNINQIIVKKIHLALCNGKIQRKERTNLSVWFNFIILFVRTFWVLISLYWWYAVDDTVSILIFFLLFYRITNGNFTREFAENNNNDQRPIATTTRNAATMAKRDTVHFKSNHCLILDSIWIAIAVWNMDKLTKSGLDHCKCDLDSVTFQNSKWTTIWKANFVSC